MTKCTWAGTMFPLFEPGEFDWPNPIRAILYLLGLGYLFLAVAVVSDVFMNGIEKITSAKKRVTDKKTGRKVTVYVWNATVANLTLMALGSSAPEILLSLIEISSDNFFLGPLGAGTIVGSAAFNLLIISAVCVTAIPDGEVRFIKEVHVYIITASFSVFAYVWLFLIVFVISKDVCEMWEAIVTLIYCPILVVLAYFADRGYFKKKGAADQVEGKDQVTVSDDATEDELAQIEQDIRAEHGQNLTDDQVVKIMRAQYFQNRSRAYYRHQAMGALHGQHRELTSVPPPEFIVQEVLNCSDEIDKEKEAKKVKFAWASDVYSFLENVGKAKLVIIRAGPKHCKAQVRYSTKDGERAVAGTDYEAVDAVAVFEKDEETKEIFVPITDNDKWEEDKQFTLALSDAKTDDGSSCTAEVSKNHTTTTVNIIDDDAPGELRFEKEEVEFQEGNDDHTEEIVVTRYNGATGKLTCQYYTDTMKATEGADFEGTKGTVEFENGQKTANIPILIKGRTRVQSATFNLVLKDPVNTKFDPKTDGGEDSCICHITVVHRDSADIKKKMMERIHSANSVEGHRNWAAQFHEAIFKIGDDDDEEEEAQEGDEPKVKEPPSKADIFMHIISMPWKLLFAFIPPVDYCGGWACFCISLVFIGLVTWLVADMANLVGCCLGLLPEENAIMFVALGTSLPDTFASQTAAMMDPYADASIGNVTGSNSVNVFLGIGISWFVAALYWETTEWESHTEYLLRASKLAPKVQENVVKYLEPGGKAIFITPAGTIYFNIAVFSVNAFFAIQHLFARRKKFGGELGGPKKGCMGQYFSATFLAFQWVIYISASSIFARTLTGDEKALEYADIS